MRILFVSDDDSIRALSGIAHQDGVATEPHEISKADQPFGLATISAIIAIVSNAAKIAEMLSKVYSRLNGTETKKVSVKTPKGSAMIELDSASTRESILQKIEQAGIL